MPYCDSQGVRIHYHVEGRPDRPPLVLQHGFTDSIGGWREFGYVDALRDDYRLILIDARGHGASDKPHDPAAYDMALRAGDVLAVLDALGVARTHYFGYSMGGRIGFDTAKRAPERLRSLIIGGSHPYPLAVDKEAVRARFGGGMQTWFDALPERIRTPSFRAQMLANDAEALIAASVDRPGLEEILPTLTMPCLLYVGEADPVSQLAARCVGLIPDATLVTLPGLDHLAGMYRSDLVLPHVTAFLASVESRTRAASANPST
jgi:pimeloyl-ACP methyl ester carboxylesterase